MTIRFLFNSLILILLLLLCERGRTEPSLPILPGTDSGTDSVTIAVLDTGVDSQHPFLRDHLWTNLGESGLDAFGNRKESNGIDDDGNGFVDDVHGWNFIDNTNSLTDENGHGTHISGILAQQSPKAKLMILKYYSQNKSTAAILQATILAYRYAHKMGAPIINYSGGGPGASDLEYLAIQTLAKANILLIAAAGNFSKNNDQSAFYPANYPLENIISVASVNSQNHLLASSNFGKASVSLAAPGENIYSSLPQNQQGEMTGTSQATAFVTASAANILARNPKLKGRLPILKELTLLSGEYSENLYNRTQTSRISSPQLAGRLWSRHTAATGAPLNYAVEMSDEEVFKHLRLPTSQP